MYIYDGGFIPLVPFQNHIPDDIKIYHFQSGIIQGYVPDFTHSLISTVHGKISVGVVL